MICGSIVGEQKVFDDITLVVLNQKLAAKSTYYITPSLKVRSRSATVR
jgi:hypothetical protein